MSFKSDIDKIIAKTTDRLKKTVEGVRIEMSERVINRTPVDTMQPGDGGLAKANWMPSVNIKDTSTTPSKDKYGDKTKEKARAAAGKNIEGVFFLCNSLEYIRVLEYGEYPNPPKKGTYLTSRQSKDGKNGPGYHKFSSSGYSGKAPHGHGIVTGKQIGRAHV